MGGRRPSAIVLTHGHFDHVGALNALRETWDVPIYCHVEELPYVTGARAYPPPDPSVGGGVMARLATLYPRQPIDLGGQVRALPSDGTVPTLPAWRWIHTPGHTAGHVSLFREADRTLIVGDAFCTTKQESLLAVASQRPELHGPPAYFTTDWDAARDSVERLAAASAGADCGRAMGNPWPVPPRRTRSVIWPIASMKWPGPNTEGTWRIRAVRDRHEQRLRRGRIPAWRSIATLFAVPIISERS